MALEGVCVSIDICMSNENIVSPSVFKMTEGLAAYMKVILMLQFTDSFTSTFFA
jgi:hypothetical protein